MTFTIKVRGASRLICSEYMCPEHGRFEVDVERDAAGDPPEYVLCAYPVTEDLECGWSSEWCISAPLARVKAWEVVRGGWQKPERKTWLDTRELGEGMEMDEFREKRKAIRDEQRRQEIRDL